MSVISTQQISAIVVAALASTVLTWAGGFSAAQAAPNVSALVATAERNTNTVHTLVHHDTDAIVSPNVTVNLVTSGSEDEVHNREQDHGVVSVVGRGPGGKVKRLHYTVDLVFMKGLTYYRTSFTGKGWKTHAGMTFPDPYTGGWKRGRTTVSFPKSFVFHQVSVSGGQTQVRATFSAHGTAGTVDLWISNGAKPYIVRQLENYHATKGTPGSARIEVRFGPFNQPAVIQPPTTLGST